MKNKMKKLSVTIGIPAYNEEENIARLLYALKSQKSKTFILERVIVVSDGSSDNTISEAKKVAWDKVEILINKRRLGLNPGENKILRKTKSDILILLDADILPEKNNFIERLIKPFYNGKNIGVVGADTISLKGSGFIEQVLSGSHEFKKCLYRQINGGNNIYNCHGRVRAFSKLLYSSLEFPKNCPEDAYSYLYCLSMGFAFKHTRDTNVVFRSPTNIPDQIKQSKRFEGGKKILTKYFNRKAIEDAYKIPVSAALKALFIFLSKHPLLALTYFLIVFYIRFINRIPSIHKIKYETSVSTKKLLTDRGLI